MGRRKLTWKLQARLTQKCSPCSVLGIGQPVCRVRVRVSGRSGRPDPCGTRAQSHCSSQTPLPLAQASALAAAKVFGKSQKPTSLFHERPPSRPALRTPGPARNQKAQPGAQPHDRRQAPRQPRPPLPRKGGQPGKYHRGQVLKQEHKKPPVLHRPPPV